MLEQSSNPVAVTDRDPTYVGAPIETELSRLDANNADAAAVTAFKRKRLGVFFYIAAGWLILLLFLALFAKVLPIKDPLDSFPISRKGPSVGHWFGGDNIGRDVFSRCIYGARRSLSIGFFSYAGALIIGAPLGMMAGYYRGRLEGVITGALDVLLAFPPLILLIAITSFLGFQARNLILSLMILATPNVARIIRAQTLRFRDREFVLAARTIGTQNLRIMVREILPNVSPAVGGFALVGIANLIVAEGALAFVGASDPNVPSWGVMINLGRSELDRAPHMVLFPALMIFLTVLSMNYVGDKTRERLEVKESNV